MNKDYLKALLAAVLFFGLIVLYVFEFKYFHNTFEIRSLLLTAVAVGLFIGIGLSWILTRDEQEAYERLRISLGVSILAILFSPLLLSWVNRLLSFQPTQTERVEFVRQEGFSASRFGNYIGKDKTADGVYTYIIREGQLKRLKSKQPIFPQANEGDQVNIEVMQGALGWKLVVNGM